MNTLRLFFGRLFAVRFTLHEVLAVIEELYFVVMLPPGCYHGLASHCRGSPDFVLFSEPCVVRGVDVFCYPSIPQSLNPSIVFQMWLRTEEYLKDALGSVVADIEDMSTNILGFVDAQVSALFRSLLLEGRAGSGRTAAA